MAQSPTLSAALDTPDHTDWRVEKGTTGEAAWQVVTGATAHDRVDALRYTAPAPWPAQPEFSTILRGPAAVSFWWKAENGSLNFTGAASGWLPYAGAGQWEQRTGFLPPGVAKVSWLGDMLGSALVDTVKIDTTTLAYEEGLDATQLEWSSSGWTGLATEGAADGVDCAVATAATGSWLQTTVTGPAVVSFDFYRTGGVSRLDDAPVSWQAVPAWSRGYIPVPRGRHLLRWENFLVLDQIVVAEPSTDIAGMLDTTMGNWKASDPGPLGVRHSTAAAGGDMLVFASVKPWLPQWVETTVTGPGTVTWRGAVTIEGRLKLTVNNAEVFDGSNYAVGFPKPLRVHVPAGTQTLRWTAQFAPESGDISGPNQVTAMLDDVQFQPGPAGVPTLVEALDTGAPAFWTEQGEPSGNTGWWQILTGSAARDGVDAITAAAPAILKRRLTQASEITFYYKGGPASVGTRAGFTSLPAVATWTQRTLRSGAGADTVQWSASSGTLSLDSVVIEPLAGILEAELDAPGVFWATRGYALYHAGTAADSFDGVDCAVAGPVAGNVSATSVLEAAVQGPGTLTWRWRMTGRGNVSYSVDNPDAAYPLTAGTGWSPVQVWVPEGPHIISFHASFDAFTLPWSLAVDTATWTAGSAQSAASVLGQPQWNVSAFAVPAVQIAPPDAFSATPSMRLENAGCLIGPPLDGPVCISWDWRNNGTTFGGWFVALPDDDRALGRWPALVRQQQVSGFQTVCVYLPAGRWRCGWRRQEMNDQGTVDPSVPLTPMWLKNVVLTPDKRPSPGAALGMASARSWTVNGRWAAVHEVNLNRRRIMLAGWPGESLTLEGILPASGRMTVDAAVPQRLTVTQADLTHAMPGYAATTTFFPTAGAPPLRFAMTSELLLLNNGYPPAMHVMPGIGVSTWQPQTAVPLATAIDQAGLAWTAPGGGWSGAQTTDAWSGGSSALATAGLPLRATVTGPGLLRLWHRTATGGTGNASLEIKVDGTLAATPPTNTTAWLPLEIDIGPGGHDIEMVWKPAATGLCCSGLLVDGAVFLPGQSTGFGAAAGQPSWRWVREGTDWTTGSAGGQPLLTNSAFAGISTHGTWLQGPGLLYMELLNAPEYIGPGYQHYGASLSGGWSALFYQLPAGRCYAQWQKSGGIRKVSFQPGPLPSAVTALNLPADSAVRMGPESAEWAPIVNGAVGTQGLRARLRYGLPLPWLEADLTGPGVLTLPAPTGILNLQQRYLTLFMDGAPFSRSPADDVLYFPVPAGRHTLRWQLEGTVLDLPLKLTLTPWVWQAVNPALTIAGVLGDSARAWQSSGSWQPVDSVPAAFRPESTDANAVMPPAAAWGARSWLQTTIAGPAQVNYALSTHDAWSLQLDDADASLPFNSTVSIPAGRHVLRFIYSPANSALLQAVWTDTLPAPPPRLGRVTVTPNTPATPLTITEIPLARALDAPGLIVAGFPASAVTGINTVPGTRNGDCASIPGGAAYMEAVVTGPSVAEFSWTGGSEPLAPSWQMRAQPFSTYSQLRVEGFGALDANLPFSWTRTALPVGPGTRRLQWRAGGQPLLVDNFSLTAVAAVPLATALETALPLLMDPPDSWQGGTWAAAAADGTDCATCRLAAGDAKPASLTSLITGPRRILFRWRVTGESPYGINFRLLVNGQPLLTCAPGPGWSLAACELPAGSQLLRWEGNNSTATAETTAWLDTIQTAPAAWFGWLRERERTLYTDPAADPDGDGFGSFDEFAYGSDPWSATSVFRPPLASFTTTGSQRYLSLTWRRGPGTSGLPFLAEYSPDLLTWRSDAAGIVPVSSIPNADGSVTETVRSAIPASAAPRRFLRVHPDGP